jgi:hypothetical protein
VVSAARLVSAALFPNSDGQFAHHPDARLQSQARRLPWTIPMPLGHTPGQNHPHRRGFTDGATDSSWQRQFLPLALSLSATVGSRGSTMESLEEQGGT